MTLGKAIESLMLTCLRCGHQWLRRSPAKPRGCPRCKSPYWDRPRRNVAKPAA